VPNHVQHKAKVARKGFNRGCQKAIEKELVACCSRSHLHISADMTLSRRMATRKIIMRGGGGLHIPGHALAESANPSIDSHAASEQR